MARNSILYIYADGAKKNATKEDVNKIQQTRNIIRQKQWCKKVFIKESDKNKGLAESIIDGVTEVVNKHGKVIVLEDDLITASGFLKYMNQALDIYANEEKVGCVHAWNYQLSVSGYDDSTFFLKGADCWGWATWQRAWKLFNKNSDELINIITSKNLVFEFNRRNTHAFLNMLEDQVSGKNDSWAVRWHASLFLENKYCLHPVKSLVKNMGLDASGTHCTNENIPQSISEKIKINKIPVKESEWFFKAYSQYLNRGTGKWQRLKTSLKNLLPR